MCWCNNYNRSGKLLSGQEKIRASYDLVTLTASKRRGGVNSSGLHTDGRTDRYEEANSRFSQFC